MDWRQGVRLVAGIVALGTFALVSQSPPWLARFANTIEASQSVYAAEVKLPERAPAKKGRLFTNAEVYVFLAAAKHAELAKDPLQRCLSYPDPPDSHWSPAAVQAYCRYRMQSIMSFADMQALIQNGQAAELDKRMAVMLHAQQTQPDARGLLDRTYQAAFDGSFDERPMLDAWKRDSPKSAFAFAASGLAYEKMAHAARGSEDDIAPGGAESMVRLLQQADADLEKAIELNPQITPAYVAMISVGGHVGARQYLQAVITRALVADPTNFSIYDAMLWNAQPNWGGSIKAMTAVVAAAQTHAVANPMMTLLQAKVPAYDMLNDCDCHSAEQLASYTAIFDQVGTAQQLLSAAYAAESSHNLGLAAVYFSEALRFEPALADERLHRIYALNDFDESQWAVNEATDMMRASPKDVDPVKARAYSYTMLNDQQHAEKDTLAALALAPGDQQELERLDALYINAKQWQKAWDTNNRFIQFYPNDAYGWVVRARIQKLQPRAGMQQTVDYFGAHFDTPQNHKNLLQLRADLALQPPSLR